MSNSTSNYHESLLQKAFEFTPQDLSENRQGQLSPAQVERLRRRAGRLALIIIGVLGVLGVLTVLSARNAANEVPIFLLCLAVPALITLAFTVGTTEAAILPRVVTKRTGQVHLAYGLGAYVPPLDYGQQQIRRRFHFGYEGSYRMIIGEQEYIIGREQYFAMQPGIYVAIYLVATIDRIVSVEVIDSKTLPPPAALPSISDDDSDVIRA
jgi:hypothetical protein